nr:unnamed protein product [Callosobruchus chinensis]
MSEVTGISRTSIHRILKHYKWHPYKIQLLQELNEDDNDRRLQFCEIMHQWMIMAAYQQAHHLPLNLSKGPKNSIKPPELDRH